MLAVIDLGAIALALGVATAVAPRLRDIELTVQDYFATAAWVVMWLAALWMFGTYALKYVQAGSTEYRRAIKATFMAAGAIGITSYLLAYDYPRTLFVTWMIAGVATLCLVRLTRRRTVRSLHHRDLFVTPVLMAGSGRHVGQVARVLQRERWLGYRIAGVVTDDRGSATVAGAPVLGTMARLPGIVEATKVPVVVFAEGSFSSPGEFRRLAWRLEQSDTQLLIAPTLADVSADRLAFHPVAGLPLVDVASPTATKALHWLKRTVDVLGSAAMLLLLSPVLVAAMIAVRLEDGGPVLFRQRRVGLNGVEFACLKLRSMGVEAEAELAELQGQNEGAGLLFKLKDDPRVTKTGRFIRRYSIDELPQLWNALRGDMSLVGPRPALPDEVAKYDFDTRRRLRVRPGLTGLWQVSGRSGLSWEETVRLDLYYVDNWSFVQDLMILLRTGKAVVSSTGAY